MSDKSNISGFLQVSRPTVALWIRRFEAEHLAGLEDKSRAPKSPARKVWLPLMIEVYHLQKRHPDAASFASGACWPTTPFPSARWAG